MKEIKEISIIDVWSKAKYEKWLESYPVLANKKVEQWIIGKAEKYSQDNKEIQKFKTTNYLRPLNEFCLSQNDKKTDISEIPNLLLNENQNERNTRVMRYLKDLLEKGLNEGTVKNNYQSRICSFYSYHGAKITSRLESVKTGTGKPNLRLDKEKIQKILTKISNPSYKIALKLASLCGLRASDILEELVSSKNGSNEPKYHIEFSESHMVYYIPDFNTHKERVKINYVFLPNELVLLLQTVYNTKDITTLDLRKIMLNRIKEGGKYESKTIIDKDIRDTLKRVVFELGYLKRIPKLDKEGKQVYKEGIPLNTYDKKLGLHSFRRFFTSNLRKLDFPIAVRNHFEGHTNQNLDDAYNRNLADLDYMYDYFKQINEMSFIDVEIRDNTDEKVIELKKENLNLYQKLDNLESKFETLLKIFEEKAIDLDMSEEEFKDWKRKKNLK